eukprot:258744-Rhodomonas_salina.1
MIVLDTATDYPGPMGAIRRARREVLSPRLQVRVPLRLLGSKSDPHYGALAKSNHSTRKHNLSHGTAQADSPADCFYRCQRSSWQSRWRCESVAPRARPVT